MLASSNNFLLASDISEIRVLENPITQKHPTCINNSASFRKRKRKMVA